MWYFSWILGIGLACAFAILNAMWYELHSDDEARKRADTDNPPRCAGAGVVAAHQRGDGVR